jgi:WD40 repeat protein
MIKDLVICGGTNKTIEIFDMNVAKSSMAIHEAHSRVFHQIVQNGSEFNQYSYDLFATTAPGDGVKLWDLRTGECVILWIFYINVLFFSNFTILKDV